MNVYPPRQNSLSAVLYIHYGAYDKKKSDTTSQEMSMEYNSSGTLAMLLCLDLNFQMI